MTEHCKNWKYFIETETEDLKKEFRKLSISLGVNIKDAERVFIKNCIESWALVERLAVCQKCKDNADCGLLKSWKKSIIN